MKSKKVTIYQLTFMAMMAAVTCILGPLSVPIGQIPISLTNLVIYFTVFVLGIWAGTGSYGISDFVGFERFESCIEQCPVYHFQESSGAVG